MSSLRNMPDFVHNNFFLKEKFDSRESPIDDEGNVSSLRSECNDCGLGLEEGLYRTLSEVQDAAQRQQARVSGLCRKQQDQSLVTFPLFTERISRTHI